MNTQQIETEADRICQAIASGKTLVTCADGSHRLLDDRQGFFVEFVPQEVVDKLMADGDIIPIDTMQ